MSLPEYANALKVVLEGMDKRLSRIETKQQEMGAGLWLQDLLICIALAIISLNLLFLIWVVVIIIQRKKPSPPSLTTSGT